MILPALVMLVAGCGSGGTLQSRSDGDVAGLGGPADAALADHAVADTAVADTALADDAVVDMPAPSDALEASGTGGGGAGGADAGGAAGGGGGGGVVASGHCDTADDCQRRGCCGGTCVPKSDPIPTPRPTCNVYCAMRTDLDGGRLGCGCVNHQCTDEIVP
jgi:hypothetical protein